MRCQTALMSEKCKNNMGAHRFPVLASRVQQITTTPRFVIQTCPRKSGILCVERCIAAGHEISFVIVSRKRVHCPKLMGTLALWASCTLLGNTSPAVSPRGRSSIGPGLVPNHWGSAELSSLARFGTFRSSIAIYTFGNTTSKRVYGDRLTADRPSEVCNCVV